jgi:hypothetical protein
VIDGGAEVRTDPGVPANSGGTHDSMSACVVTDSRLRTPMNAESGQNLTAGRSSRTSALVAGWIGFTDGGECVVLVADEQQVAPGAFRTGGDSRDPVLDGALEVELRHSRPGCGLTRTNPGLTQD